MAEQVKHFDDIITRRRVSRSDQITDVKALTAKVGHDLNREFTPTGNSLYDSVFEAAVHTAHLNYQPQSAERLFKAVYDFFADSDSFMGHPRWYDPTGIKGGRRWSNADLLLIYSGLGFPETVGFLIVLASKYT
jgi:hypothetical protein